MLHHITPQNTGKSIAIGEANRYVRTNSDNLSMGDVEPKLQALGYTNIMVWKRFIDDIFIIWKGTKVEFLEYMDRINTIHHSIKFTHECSEQEIDFLDATIYKGDRFQAEHILDVKTHIKPTNKQLYVHASSYHPPKHWQINCNR